MPPAAPVTMVTVTARMHVNSDSSLFDEAFGLHSTSLDGTQRQGFRGFGHDGQADSGDGSATYDSRKHATAINFLHGSAPHLKQNVLRQINHHIVSREGRRP
jgi:hypothetical protein